MHSCHKSVSHAFGYGLRVWVWPLTPSQCKLLRAAVSIDSWYGWRWARLTAALEGIASCLQVDNWDHMERFYQQCILK